MDDEVSEANLDTQILEEYDLYVQAPQDDNQLMLFQYPMRPLNRPYG